MQTLNLETLEHGELIHIWQGSRQKIMVSFENTKRLWGFSNFNHAITDLYALGFKETARLLNKAKH